MSLSGRSDILEFEGLRGNGFPNPSLDLRKEPSSILSHRHNGKRGRFKDETLFGRKNNCRQSEEERTLVWN